MFIEPQNNICGRKGTIFSRLYASFSTQKLPYRFNNKCDLGSDHLGCGILKSNVGNDKKLTHDVTIGKDSIGLHYFTNLNGICVLGFSIFDYFFVKMK